MGFWTWTFIILAVVAVFIAKAMKMAKESEQELDSKLSSLPDFSPTQRYMGSSDNGIAIDDARKKICLIKHGYEKALHSLRVISHKDIVSVELFEDGISITKTDRSSQVGGAVVGGLLFGGLGAVVGGLSGKTETSKTVKRIDLRLIVNDTKAPLHDLSFLVCSDEKGGPIYKDAMEKARLWNGILQALIKQAESEEKSLQNNGRQTPAALPNNSVADEIKKLADLHHSGVLTLDEFQQQKTRLLGQTNFSAN
jgi:hypothetical protein